jgi:hypothetical protein
MYMTFETKNVKSLYRSFSLKIVAKELVKYKFRRTFQPKWEEVIGGWRKQHNEKLNNL